MSSVVTRPRREEEVLALVQALVRELDPRRGTRPITLDASLDRDLGIGSLERVELFLRLERAFGVRLADDAVAGAATVRDLVSAVEKTSPAAAESDPAPSAAAQGEGFKAADSTRTLVDVLRWHVQRTPDRIHLFLREDDGREQQITYAQLWEEAVATAAGLQQKGLAAGECVAMLLRTERAFFSTYFGVLLAGGVPVPLYPPFRADQIQEYAARQAAILRNAESRIMVTFDRAERVAGLLKPLAPAMEVVTTADDLRSGARGRATSFLAPSFIADDSLALIQYTSGSTGSPKGVALTHGNLLANIRAFGVALGARPDDVGVSWLPLYHDMGLIGMWLGSLFHGLPVVVMSPLAFLSRPARWLKAFQAHGGTISAAPNFAYDLCARKIDADDLAGLDLRSWRAALNGAEAVSAETIERFTTRFAACGFRAEAMRPVYGLAETSLCLTAPDPDEAPRIDRIARDPFQHAREIRPAPPGDACLPFVGCGKPIPTTEMRIIDPGGKEVGERKEGRIQFRGPSATAGYYRNPEATAELIEDGWLNTGDLGYWSDGHIYLTGRAKEVIIAGGRNIYPQELEAAVAEIPGVRRGCVAAFGSYDTALGTERLVVVAESREREAGARDVIRNQAIARVVDIVGVPPDDVAIVRPGAIPKTSSGKIRRAVTRERYERGVLERGQATAVRQWVTLLAANAAWRVAETVRRLGWRLYTFYLWVVVGLGMLALRMVLSMARSGEMQGQISRTWCRLVFRLGLFEVRYPSDWRSLSDSDSDSGAVVVANHASYMDALLLRAALPAFVRMAAKDRLLSYPFVGGLLARCNVVAVTRGQRSSVDTLAEVVRGGGAFAIFPEGTFMRSPGLMPFRLGAFQAAVETGRPVVPVAIRGTRQAWPDETVVVRRRPLSVVVGPRLDPQGTGWPEIVRLRDAARAWLAEATGEPLRGGHTSESGARASGRVEGPTE